MSRLDDGGRTARRRLPAVALCAAAALAAAPAARAQDDGPDLPGPVAQAAGESPARAADAFLATLDGAQRDAVLFDFDDAEQRARWSNFPVDIVEREGLSWGELAGDQRRALNALLGAVLSPDGMTMVRRQMAADDVLAAEQERGNPRRRLTFGSDHYYVALLGEPSPTEPWTLQFGGHHLAINATVVGPRLTLAPSLTGGQPLAFELDGEPVYIVAEEVSDAAALLGALSDAQRETAVVADERIDLVLGPGQDGRTLAPEGLAGADMDGAQRALLLALIEARLGIGHADAFAAAMATAEAELDRTHFAWFGPTDEPALAYFRVTGPSLLLEFSPQDMGGDPSQHAHNMYRDPTNEYGAAWTSPD